ncbi:MAG TPA: carboxypeptidase regulatory-like domain-containing protein [Candidatus Angelobacter sp.]|nr:carboxypeptidase regulatory-like domain-containing protein [Candidatus Angelobacter sp.]
MAAFLFSVALMLGHQANTTNQAPTTPPEEKCTVSGKVLSAANEAPLKGATISMHKLGGNGDFSAETDEAGRFEIKNVEPGKYWLVASHPGFLDMYYGDHPHFPEHLVISPGQTSEDISFRLPPEAIITGHVYDQDGKPIEHAFVQPMSAGYAMTQRTAFGDLSDFRPTMMTYSGAYTDRSGKFTINRLEPGSYIVRAEALSASAGAFKYMPVFYRGVPHASEASRVTIRAGTETSGVDFFLERVKTFHIRGRVINAVKIASPAEIEVQLLRHIPHGDWGDAAGGDFHPAVHVKDSQGSFDIPDLLPGSYWLSARLEDGNELELVRRPVTVVKADVEGIRLFLTPGPALAGSVEVEGSVTLPSLQVSLVNYFFTSYNWKHNEAAVKADGTFKFDGVPDGEYFLRVSGLPQNFYLKSAILGGQDVLDSGFEVSGGLAPGPRLKIVVGADGGQLAGTVMLDSNPVGGALVTLLPADSSKLSSDYWCKSAEADENGKFAFAGIRPGEYRVFAWQKIIPPEVRNPAFLARFEDRGQEVQVGSGAPFTLQLDAIPASETLALESPY